MEQRQGERQRDTAREAEMDREGPQERGTERPMEGEKERVGNTERGRGTERERVRNRGAWRRYRSSQTDGPEQTELHSLTPSGLLPPPPSTHRHPGLLGTLWESPVRKHRRPSAFLSISVHLLDCSSPLSSGDPACPWME